MHQMKVELDLPDPTLSKPPFSLVVCKKSKAFNTLTVQFSFNFSINNLNLIILLK